jgi:hypothetical protein|tara:strand:+ start:250 stop:450 length:201 start_codon:yes stop_codon:yes gene_type:complete
MKKFKSFLYDTVIGDPELDEIVEEIQPELDEPNINIIKETPTRPLGWNKKLCMTSCKNGHFTFDYI